MPSPSTLDDLRGQINLVRGASHIPYLWTGSLNECSDALPLESEAAASWIALEHLRVYHRPVSAPAIRAAVTRWATEVPLFPDSFDVQPRVAGNHGRIQINVGGPAGTLDIGPAGWECHGGDYVPFRRSQTQFRFEPPEPSPNPTADLAAFQQLLSPEDRRSRFCR